VTREASLPLSVVVVTHNEEERIRECLESVFATCRPLEEFEVLLVDSNSDDRTVERAMEYPVTVLRIPDDDLTTPGAGRYVGGKYADGELILFVDGDMVLTEGWLTEAMDLVREEGVAAVDGHLDEVPDDAETEPVDSVRGVALYDAEALRSVGGFDPFLESVEDISLGYDLNAAGYRLLRLPVVTAHHPGTTIVSESFRRWRKGYTRGNGQAIRKSLSSPRTVAKHVYRMRQRLVIGGWLGVGAVSLATGVGVLPWLALSVVGFGFVATKRDGPKDAAVYCLYKASLLFGVALGLLAEPKPREAFPLERVEPLEEGPVLEGSSALSDR
jgi:GT2 family glycosyltransferase